VLLGEGGLDHLGVQRVIEGLRFTASLEALQEIAVDPPETLRVFLGYAGWGPGQLSRELAQGAWLVAPAAPDLVFESPAESLWDEVVGQLGIDPNTLVATRGEN